MEIYNRFNLETIQIFGNFTISYHLQLGTFRHHSEAISGFLPWSTVFIAAFSRLYLLHIQLLLLWSWFLSQLCWLDPPHHFHCHLLSSHQDHLSRKLCDQLQLLFQRLQFPKGRFQPFLFQQPLTTNRIPSSSKHEHKFHFLSKENFPKMFPDLHFVGLHTDYQRRWGQRRTSTKKQLSQQLHQQKWILKLYKEKHISHIRPEETGIISLYILSEIYNFSR